MASQARKAKTWPFIILGIVSLILVIILLLAVEPSTPLKFFLHTAALMGYLMIFFSSLSSIYLRELVRRLGRPFIQTHHIVAVTGLAMITLHPILAAIDAADPRVFVPNSWLGLSLFPDRRTRGMVSAGRGFARRALPQGDRAKLAIRALAHVCYVLARHYPRHTHRA